MGPRRSWSNPAIARALVLVLAITLAAAAPLARTRAQDAGEPVAGGTLRIVQGVDPDTLDPPMTILGDSYAVISMIYDRLVAIDPETGLPEPWLAESWEASDDGLTLTFTLRDGITFTDGTPLNAEAVKFNLDRWINLETAGTVDLGTLESVDAPDERTVVLNFSEPFAPIYSSLSALGIHSPTAYEADPDNFGRNPVGSGPFMLTEWEPATRLRLDRNPDYINYYPFDENDGAAYLDAIEIYIITEAATQTAAFENGELDVLGISREDFARLEAMPGVTIQTVPESTVMYHLQYADEPPYDNVAFRQAVSHAINAEQVVELAYLGGAAVNQCPIATALTGHDPELCAEHGYTYDPEAAKQLLADAGWTDADGDGFVEFEGVTEPIILYTYGPNPSERRAIELMQGDLQAVGIQTDIRVMEIASLIDGISNGEVKFVYLGWGYPDPVMLTAIFKSPGWAGENSNDPDLDALLVAADSALDPEARIERIGEVMVYILDNAVMTPVLTPAIDHALHSNVNGFKLDVANVPHYTDVWLAPE